MMSKRNKKFWQKQEKECRKMLNNERDVQTKLTDRKLADKPKPGLVHNAPSDTPSPRASVIKFPDTFELMVNKGYLDWVSNTSVVKVIAPKELSDPDLLQSFRIHKLEGFVYDAKEDRLDKLSSVFSALHSAGNAVFIILDNRPSEGHANIYLGVRTEGANAEETDESDKLFSKALKGNFPGIKLGEKLIDDKSKRVIQEFANKENVCVAAITGVPSFKREGIDATNFTQGLEKLVEAMGNERYTAFILSEPVSREDLKVIEQGYQDLYTQLSLLNVSNLSVSEQVGISQGETFSESITKGIAHSISTTNSVTNSKAETRTYSSSNTIGFNFGRSAGNSTTSLSALGKAGGLVNGIGQLISGVGMAIPHPIAKAITTGVGIAIGGVGSAIGSYGKTCTECNSVSSGISFSHSSTDTKGETDTIATSDGKSVTASDSIQNSETTSQNVTTSQNSGVSYQYGVQQKRLLETLKVLDEQLERIRTGKNFGMWNWGAYIIAHDSSTAKIGANIFNGIFRGESSGVERSGVSIWTKGGDDERDKREAYDNIISSLSYLQHPIFALSDIAPVRTTSLLNTRELAVGMSLPQKSLPGLPVLTAVEFGRSVSSKIGANTNRSIDLGPVSHLGTISDGNSVNLDIDSLASHVFVSGSTGSGKSNVVYNLIDKLSEKKVHYLVVEPAKGEYKKVFGGRKGVKSFGTNPDFGDVLRINPFSFPESIHVVEHIDRLIEILNVAWPMYAAMPAMLKDAVEKTYEKMGWDLTTSKNRYGKRIFPDFHDLLDVLPQTIQASEYDREVKNNYAGALLTRIRSMTNGYFRLVFQKDELNDKTLFDNDCLLDFSRVGSSETIALLMGVVFLRLHEYRMSTADKTDSKLKHITVLEEAHRLLKNTTIGMGPEGVNLQGKSVEMMTNAIAEMRTYGEGFVIVDQAPALLDPAVIRNTNTKIVLRLPDYQDRLLIGKSANLNDEQIDELARLPLGCAAVYQSNWEEAVLCQVGKHENHGDVKPQVEIASRQQDLRTQAEMVLLETILKKYRGLETISISPAYLDIIEMYYPWYADQLKGQVSREALLVIFYEQFVKRQKPKINNPTREHPTREQWTRQLINNVLLNTSIRILKDDDKKLAQMAILESLSMCFPRQHRTYFLEKKDMLDK